MRPAAFLFLLQKAQTSAHHEGGKHGKAKIAYSQRKNPEQYS